MKAKIIYIGKRFVNDVIRQRFVLAKKPNDAFSFKGNINGVLIGLTYWGEVDGKDDVSMPKRPERVSLDFHDLTDQWRAEDKVAITESRERAVRANADKLPDLKREVELIKKFTKGLRFSERRAFVDWLMNEIERDELEKQNAALNRKVELMLRRKKKRK